MADKADGSADACPVDHKTREVWLQTARQGGKDAASHPPMAAATSHFSLDESRQVSTIPRAFDEDAGAGRLSNNEQESGASAGGNWIYPSQKMFFDAMRRKQYDPQERDMASVVPIHNAVNERVWREIKAWEGAAAERYATASW